MDYITLAGSLAVLLTQSGEYPEALALHAEIEKRLQDHNTNDDYAWNMIAALTQQIDCLTIMGRHQEALRKIAQAEQLAGAARGLPADGLPRLLAQKGALLSELDRFDDAKKCFEQAIESSPPSVGIAATLGFRHALAQVLFKNGKDDEALAQLDLIENTVGYEAAGLVRSRVLDIRGRILTIRGDPKAIDYLLESYEVDRRRNDIDGMAVSLLSLAEAYLKQGSSDPARERLTEAEVLITRAGLSKLSAKAAAMREQIQRAKRTNN